jgi:shikimate dehydrogenase
VLDDDGRVRGESTDGEGFLRALADEGQTVAGRDVLVVGAGGAARAIVRAVGEAGGQVTVAARRMDTAQAAAGLVPGGRPVALDDVDAGAYAVIVQATPVGMRGEPAPFATEGLGPDQFVYDTVYPGETPLVVAARARGAGAVNGTGMLVHQGAIAFELFTGQEPPLDVMRAAVGA